MDNIESWNFMHELRGFVQKALSVLFAAVSIAAVIYTYAEMQHTHTVSLPGCIVAYAAAVAACVNLLHRP